MLIDTHCHLDFPQFDADRDLVIQQAKEAGISYFINIGSTLESSSAACALARKYPEIYASVGVHPHDADNFNRQTEDSLKELARNNKVVAIGETGLDYYRNLSSEKNQKQAFNKQIELAKALNLPLVLHCRQAAKQVMQILEAAMPLRAVVHCFSGSKDFLNDCLKLGFFISFTCNVTYKKAQDLKELVKSTPLDRLMLETDAPYLSPEEFRGKRNTPAQIKLLAQQVARIKGVSFEQIADKTTQNAKAFFKLI